MSVVNQKYNITVGNNAQKILPVPIQKNPAPSVPDPTYYGSSPHPMPLKPTSRKNDESQYCNTLSPPPRNQQMNVPYQGNKNCPEFKSQPYSKDSCYLMDNKRQGVIGVVCNQSGGSDNANFKRGNQFGLDYEWNLFDNIKKKEYTVEQPVQMPINLENPSIVDNQTLFHPTTNYYLSKSKDYKTYPRPNNFTENGLPTYVYPYKTMNKRTQENNNKINYNYDNNRKELANLDNIENFSNLDKNKNMRNLFSLLIFILIILVIIYFTKR